MNLRSGSEHPSQRLIAVSLDLAGAWTLWARATANPVVGVVKLAHFGWLLDCESVDAKLVDAKQAWHPGVGVRLQIRQIACDVIWAAPFIWLG